MSGDGVIPSATLASAEADCTVRAQNVWHCSSASVLKFSEDCLVVPDILEVTWEQVAVADIRVSDFGRHIELCLASGNHAVFDFARLAVPMGPSSAKLIQIVQDKCHLGKIPGLLLRWPCASLYAAGIRMTDAMLWHTVASSTLEMLFGMMFISSLGRIMRSSGAGLTSSIQQLGQDLSNLFEKSQHVDHGIAPLLRPYLGEDSALIQWAEFFVQAFWPARLVVFAIWHVTDFASDALILLLLMQHLLSFGYFVSRLISAFRSTTRVALGAARVVRSINSMHGTGKREKKD